MSGGANNRGGLEIMNDILAITREMAGSENADLLIDSLERRGRLMDEYDRVKAGSPELIEAKRPQIDKVKSEIAKLNNEVEKNLHKLRSQVKEDLKNSSAQKKILGYTSQAMSASGSYMDFKK